MGNLRKDFADYFAIDWQRTGDKIRTLLHASFSGDNYVKAISIALCRSERTVFSWLDETDRHPSTEDLLLLSKYLNVSLDDLIEVKGDSGETSARSLFDRYIEEEIGFEDEDETVRMESEFASVVLMHESKSREYPIKSLFDLVLYLPLIPKEVLEDSLARIQGAVYGRNQDYVLDQMKYCYDEINDLEARKYADSKRKYLSGRLSVYDITDKTRDRVSNERYDEWRIESQKESEAYRRYCEDKPCDTEVLTPTLAYRMALSEYTSSMLFINAVEFEKAKDILSQRYSS